IGAHAGTNGEPERLVGMVGRLVVRVHQRRSVGGSDPVGAMAFPAPRLVGALPFGQRRWHRTRVDVSGWLIGPPFAGREKCGYERPAANHAVSRPMSCRARSIISRTRSRSAGTSAGPSPAVSTGASTRTVARARLNRQSCLGSALPV